jgi:hypothetical protein
MPGQITNPEDIRNYCLAGRAHLTLKSLDTRKGLRYRISGVEEPRGVDSLYFVGYWYTGQYNYIGVIRNNNFEHTRKSIVDPSDTIFLIFSMFWKELMEKNRLDPCVEFYHEDKCGRCGQPIWLPESIARGIGKGCQEYLDKLYVDHYGKSKGKQLRLFGE